MTDRKLDGEPKPFDPDAYLKRVTGFLNTYGTFPIRCEICNALSTNRVVIQLSMFGIEGGGSVRQWGGGKERIGLCEDCMLDLEDAAGRAIAARVAELQAYPERRLAR